MLQEMNGEHSGAEDAIHNWLCEQEDERLLQGILEEGRTIKGAMQHCVSLARKQKTGNAAMVDDQTVFSWVRSYFVSDEKIETKETGAVVAVGAKPEAKVKKERKRKEVPEKQKEQEQLSLLDFL
nr:Cas9 inhibitor AcrIIA9 family protein [uncultured Trichococcus sp.]